MINKVQIQEVVDKSVDEVGTLVLVIQIVGVFPNIKSQQRSMSQSERVDRIWAINDFERTIV